MLSSADPVLMANLVFIAVYAMFIWEKVPKVVVSLLGAMLVIILGIISQDQAFQYVDWNVIFLLVGMMIIVNITRETGAFDWLGYRTIKLVKGNGAALLWGLCLITAICSAFLDNVTTVLFMATITCSLATTIGMNPVPLLISETIASNIGGAATLIGDPPNILIASAGNLSFNDFIINVAPPILLILPLAVLMLQFIYRKELVLTEEQKAAIGSLKTRGLIRQPKLLWKCMLVLALVLLAFIFHHAIHMEVGTIALTGAAVLMLFEDPKDLWNDVEWDTIFFFVGLFIIVGAVEKVGTLEVLAEELFQIANGNFDTLTMILLWASGVLSAIIDNIPYTATMIPLLQNLGTKFDNIEPFWWALSLGACLGGNGSLIGATANVVVADIAAYKVGKRISFIEFIRVGFFIVVMSLAVSSAYIWWRYLGG